jgi:hypothetical protein
MFVLTNETRRTVVMKIENTGMINIEAVEREARKLRADYTAKLIASARAWVVAKFTAPTMAGTKTA